MIATMLALRVTADIARTAGRQAQFSNAQLKGLAAGIVRSPMFTIGRSPVCT